MAEEYAAKFVGKYYVRDGDTITDEMRNAGVSTRALHFLIYGPFKPKPFFSKQTFTDSDIDVELYRVIYPRTPVTRDYREERLNIIMNQNGVCERVHFG